MLSIVFATTVLLPPVCLAVLALLAVLLWRRRGRLAAIILLVPLVLLSMPMIAQAMLAALDPPPPPPGSPPQAIVILSGDAEQVSADGQVDIGPLTLERIRAGAALQRRTGLPVLVTGGFVNGPPEMAALMARSLAEDFGIEVRWVERKSGTTWENAAFSAPLLKAAGVERVYLVTHGWHMRRSLLAFRRWGVEAVPAAVRQDPWPRGRLQELVPRVSAWGRSYWALHEWVGLLYYGWRT